MSTMAVRIPQDVADEFKMSEAEWQLVFSRFVNSKFDKLKEVEAIVSKSKATSKNLDELSVEVKKAIAESFK